MKKKMHLAVKILILYLIMSFILSGCLGAREINDLEIVIGMGIDKDMDTGNILLTAQIVKEGEMGKISGGGGGGESKAYWNVTSTGKTIFDAVRQVTHKTGNRLFVSHNQAVIFGNDIASEGLQKYIDFFLRAHEMRPTTLILVAEDKASDIMNAKPETERLPAMNITKLVKSYGFTSYFYKVNMKDFTSCTMSATTSPVAPLVSIFGDMENKDVYISGMAVFKNDKMIGKLSQEESRGVLWALGKVKSGVVLVSSPDKQGNVALEILEAKSKVTPEINDGKIVVHIKIKVESSLSEQTTTENLADISTFEKIQKAQDEVIRQEIMASFNKSKELNADVFGFGEMVHKKYKNEWKVLKDNWDEIYPTIELNINVETKIQKTDLLKKAASPDVEEK